MAWKLSREDETMFRRELADVVADISLLYGGISLDIDESSDDGSPRFQLTNGGNIGIGGLWESLPDFVAFLHTFREHAETLSYLSGKTPPTRAADTIRVYPFTALSPVARHRAVTDAWESLDGPMFMSDYLSRVVSHESDMHDAIPDAYAHAYAHVALMLSHPEHQFTEHGQRLIHGTT